MSLIKKIFYRNTHNFLFRAFAGFGRTMNKFYENRNHDIFSNGELIIVKKISEFNPTVIIDGGANVGEYSLMINKFNPRSKIYSFEPVESTFNKLVNNVAPFNNIFPVKKGLYKNNSTKKINLFESDALSTIINIEGLAYESHQKETIELIRGDKFVEEHKIESIDFLKIDIEGAEYDALLGFEKSIKEGRIKAIQFEYGYINISTKKLLIDFYNFFEQYDYSIGKIFPKTVEFRKYDYRHEDFMGPNFIAVKNSERELIQRLSKR